MDLKKIEQHIRALTDVNETEEPFLSCFFNLEKGVNQCINFLLERKQILIRGLSHKREQSFLEAIEEVQNCLRTKVIPKMKGMAVFVRCGELPFLLPLKFRVPLPNQIVIGSSPHIYPLIELKDVYHRYVILIATKENARILEVNLGAITESLWTKRPELRKRVGRSWTKEHYQNHRHNRTDKFYKEKIDMLDKLMNAGGYSHLILAGSPEITSKLKKKLPKRLSDKIIDIVATNGKVETQILIEATLSSFIDHEQQESFVAVDKLRQELDTNGLAVVGEEECLKALEDRQADMLIIAQEYDNLELKNKLVQLAIQNDVHIETVRDSYLLIQNGGVGCLLRY